MQNSMQSDMQGYHQPAILVVEDDEDNLIYISYALALFKYRYFTTQDPRKGLLLAQKYQPDLIMLDIKMPQLSGIELLRMLKLNGLTSNIPVIAVTALAREQEKKLILDAGFSDYLVKPYFLEDLNRMICCHILDTSLC